MDIEIEAKFTDIDPAAIRGVLSSSGAILIKPEQLMRRKVYKHPTSKHNDWFRVRDEGDVITMSYKKMNDRSLHGTQEISYVVPDFDQACRFLESTHLRFVSYQETKRELWRYNNVEITIDTWPWVPPFIEIEGPSEQVVKEVANMLGCSWDEALYGSVENVYTKHFDVSEEEVCDWSEIVFRDVPDWLESKRKK